MTPNEQLLDSSIRSSLLALRFAESARSTVVGLFEAMLDRLRSLILSADFDGARPQEVESLALLLSSTIDEYYEEMETQLERLLTPFALQYSDRLFGAMEEALDDALVPLPALSADRLVAGSMLLGGPRTEYFADQSLQAKRAASRSLRLAAASSANPTGTVERLIGTKTGRRLSVLELGGSRSRVSARTGGALSASRNAMNSLVRTSVTSLVSDITAALAAANRRAIRGVMAITTLDGRTSPICISRSGGAWDPDTGEPLPGSSVSSPFPGYPPWHPNCRTFLAPVAEGELAKQPTYQEWLRTKPASFQKDVLGSSKYKMWKSGNLDLHRLIDPSGRPLTLEELVSRS